MIEYKVKTSLVKSNRIEGCKNSYVLHLGSRGMTVTITVNREIIHHVYIDDTFLSLEIVMYGLGGTCH